MRRQLISAVLVCLGLVMASSASADRKLTENTRKLGEGEVSPPADVASLAWLAGSWVGTGLGGEVEEIWTAPSGGTMVGAFKLLQDGEPSFYELLSILPVGDSLVLRLKHFNPDITGWEEKNDTVAFPLVELGEEVVFFEGLTYRRVGDDRLDVFLAMRRSTGVEEVGFTFRRAGGAR